MVMVGLRFAQKTPLHWCISGAPWSFCLDSWCMRFVCSHRCLAHSTRELRALTWNENSCPFFFASTLWTIWKMKRANANREQVENAWNFREKAILPVFLAFFSSRISLWNELPKIIPKLNEVNENKAKKKQSKSVIIGVIERHIQQQRLAYMLSMCVMYWRESLKREQKKSAQLNYRRKTSIVYRHKKKSITTLTLLTAWAFRLQRYPKTNFHVDFFLPFSDVSTVRFLVVVVVWWQFFFSLAHTVTFTI